MTILGTAIMKAIMMLIEMKAEEKEIVMIMKIQGEEQKGREAEAGAGTMGQGEAHQGAKSQNTLQIIRDIAWCAKSKDIIHYFTAPSYQNTFPEAMMSNLFPENYAKSASQLLLTPRIVHISTQRTTKTGYANRAR